MYEVFFYIYCKILTEKNQTCPVAKNISNIFVVRGFIRTTIYRSEIFSKKKTRGRQ